MVKIDGLPLGYTLPGAYHLLEHYQQMEQQAKVNPQKFNYKQADQHLTWLIARIKKCIAYYESILPATSN